MGAPACQVHRAMAIKAAQKSNSGTKPLAYQVRWTEIAGGRDCAKSCSRMVGPETVLGTIPFTRPVPDSSSGKTIDGQCQLKIVPSSQMRTPLTPKDQAGARSAGNPGHATVDFVTARGPPLPQEPHRSTT